MGLIDLTVPRIDSLGRNITLKGVVCHAGDIIKAHSGVYHVISVDYKPGETLVKLLKAQNRITAGNRSYIIVEMSELHKIDKIVKDNGVGGQNPQGGAASTSDTGTYNPSHRGQHKDCEDCEKMRNKAGSGGQTEDLEVVTDVVGVADKKRKEVEDKLGQILEHTKGVIIPESNLRGPQLVTKNLPSYDIDLPWGLRYVTNKAVQEEDSKTKKKDQLDKPDIENSKEAGKDSDSEDDLGNDKLKKFSDYKEGENDNEIHSAEPVPDPTENLAPRANSYLYPFGKEEEKIVASPSRKEGEDEEDEGVPSEDLGHDTSGIGGGNL